MTLQGRRVVVLAEREYEDLELWYPKLRLQEAGAEVVVAGPAEKLYLSKHGYPVSTDATVAELRAADFDGVVVPGGWAPDYLRREPSVTGFVRALSEAGKLVAAICHGGSVLVSAGVLKGRTVTSVTAIRDDLTNAGAAWVDAEVIVDENMVTARRPDDLPAFMSAIIAVLRDSAPRERSARLLVDEELVSIQLSDASFEYMVDMLNRMPGAKGYTGEDFDPASADLPAILNDFVAQSDPRGSLEAEAARIADVRCLDGGGYLARGNARVPAVLDAGDVPDVRRLGG